MQTLAIAWIDEPALALGALLMGLFGGLALFLFGMEQMTDALKAVAGEGMQKLLARLTTNRVMASISGAVVTAIIQSSSVTTVLVVGFVSAGLMSLAQSVGVIMGANVGSTITAQIVAFKVTEYALLLVAVGFLLQFVGKRESVRQWGGMVMGLGLIFFGMGLMSEATNPLRSYEPFIEGMKRMDNPALGMLAGAAFTALVQSSSATTGIVIVLASQGFITIEAGIALAFGANIGTCVTALLATLGKPRVALRTATIHVIFNVVGVLIWLAFIDRLAVFVADVSPAHPELSGTDRLAAETPRQIANAHTAFNIVNLLVFLPFTAVLARLVDRLLPDKAAVVPERARPRYLDPVFLGTPSLAIEPVRLELCRLGRHVQELADATVERIRAGTGYDRIVQEHREVETLYESIIEYIQRLQSDELPEVVQRRLGALSSVAHHIEHVSEIFATNILSLAQERRRLGVEFEEEAAAAVDRLHDATRETFRDVLGALEEVNEGRARAVIALKPQISNLARATLDQLASYISPGDRKTLAAHRLASQVVELMQRLYYFSKRIAKEIVLEVEATRVEDPELVEQPAQQPAAPG
jgi:phosphate:Na+ symporter